jgi:RND family efflux transporter MFP subunit
MSSQSKWILPLFVTLLLLGACGEKKEVAETSQQDSEISAVLIGKANVVTKDLPVWLESVGRVRSKVAPTLAAEIDARIVAVTADTGDSVEQGQLLAEMDTTALDLEQRASEADIKRFDAQIANERQRVKRYQSLAKKELISKTQLDDSLAQLDVYLAELEGARARLAIVTDKVAKAQVIAPVLGEIQERFISTGDFVKRGDPLFAIAESSHLQAWLPFPETLAARIRLSLKVMMESPVAPGVLVEGKITELQPTIGMGNRAIVAIVEIENPGSWRPGATVVGRVLVETRTQTHMVPEISLVRRPAGEVVYVIQGGKAQAHSVRTGERDDGLVEIVEGLSAGDVVATDGAAFLIDGVAVKVAEKQQ